MAASGLRAAAGRAESADSGPGRAGNMGDHGSDERRGEPTLHAIHGIPIAVNVGDALTLLALHALIEHLERYVFIVEGRRLVPSAEQTLA